MEKNVYQNRIRVVLAEKELTNRWLADKMGVKEMTVARWTTNKSQPSMSQFIDIAKILEVDLKELLAPFVEIVLK